MESGGRTQRKYIPSIVVSSASPLLPSTSAPISQGTSTAAAMAPKLPPGAQKAKGMDVNISGFYGVHSIELGMAYWYRGHYLYSTSGIPVEPIPFATKKGIHIVGTTIDTAPRYISGGAGLRYESEVAALHKSMVNAWAEQEKADGKEDDGNEVDVPESLMEGGLKAQVAQEAEITKRPQGHLRFGVARNEVENYYNDRAMFLAQSAPGSRGDTPITSRSNTPAPRALRTPSPVRPTTAAPTLRMKTILDQGPIIEGLVTLQETHPEFLNASAVNAYLDGLKTENLIPEPRRVPRVSSGTSLAELNTVSQPHTLAPLCVQGRLSLHQSKSNVSLSALSRNSSIHKDIPGPSMLDLVQARQKTASRAGRARSDSMKAASLALNAAFNDYNKAKEGDEDEQPANRALKCSLHGGNCDGVTVTKEHLTLHNLKSRGLKEHYPMVVRGDRSMIDWFTLVKEERDGGN